MIQKITGGCPCLLYLNLSYTLITNQSLRAIFSLQYLSLAHCRRFTDEGFIALTTEEGGRNLMHLDLTACIQMTPKGFEYISAGCPSLQEAVMNDMPTLSDTCVLVRPRVDVMHWCRNLFTCALGNNQITDVSWEALCGFSAALSKLHVVECPGMTDYGMRYVASLKHLNYLDVSLCSRVTDAGIKYLTEGPSAYKLHHLSISQCVKCCIFVFGKHFIRLHKLFHLNLSYCEKVTDMALEYLNGSSIQSLDLSGCNIRDQGLDSLRKIKLKKIVIAKCIFVTDMGIEVHIFQPFVASEADVRMERYQHSVISLFMPSYFPSGQKLCGNVRDLENIDISQCPALTDSSIKAISFYCRSLLRLKMAACPQVQFAYAYRVNLILNEENLSKYEKATVKRYSTQRHPV
uniref:F-box and leucine rich repeat protein 13 n=1 Tax=Xiphophorus maculatus TaxID=8083 RepID=M4A3T6_XIPMA